MPSHLRQGKARGVVITPPAKGLESDYESSERDFEDALATYGAGNHEDDQTHIDELLTRPLRKGTTRITSQPSLRSSPQITKPRETSLRAVYDTEEDNNSHGDVCSAIPSTTLAGTAFQDIGKDTDRAEYLKSLSSLKR